MRAGPVQCSFSLVVLCVKRRVIYFEAFKSIFKTPRTHYEFYTLTMRAGPVPGGFSLVVVCVERRVIYLIMNFTPLLR